MEGFAEKGTPEGWDTALGTVRGFRRWGLYLSLKPLKVLLRGWGKYGSVLASHVPQVRPAYVQGMHGGTWTQRHRAGGWHVAKCEAYTWDSIFSPRPRQNHPTPEPECGCGYWAYWNTRDDLAFTSGLSHLCYRLDGSYSLAIPLSGVIEGAGATIIGEKGFRSERARITDLALNFFSDCFFESEGIDHSGYGLTGQSARVLNTGKPAAVLLFERTGIQEEQVRETAYEAVTWCLGTDFKMHDSPEALIGACPPDENYGRPGP